MGKRAYQHRYKRDLIARVQGETSGDTANCSWLCCADKTPYCSCVREENMWFLRPTIFSQGFVTLYLRAKRQAEACKRGTPRGIWTARKRWISRCTAYDVSVQYENVAYRDVQP